MKLNIITGKREKKTYYSTDTVDFSILASGFKCLCPEEPEFWFAEDPESPPIEISNPIDITRMFGTGEIEKFGYMVEIPVLNFFDGVKSHYIPFPDDQLTLEPPEEYEETPRFEGWCRGEYYSGPEALSTDIRVLREPQQSCLWGVKDGFSGVLSICQGTLEEWKDTYYKYQHGYPPYLFY